MNKPDLIDKIILEREKLDNAIRLFKPALLELPVKPGGWTVKEVVAHITWWEQALLNDYAGLERGEPIREFNGEAEVNDVNEATRLKSSGMNPGIVLEEFRSSGLQLLDWLRMLP